MIVGLILLIPSHSTAASWIHIRPHDLGLPSDEITTIYQDQSSNLWVGTLGCGGIAEFDGMNWTTHEIDICSGIHTSIVSDGNGIVWVADDRNLTRLWRYAEGNWDSYKGSVVVGISKSVGKPVTGSSCWSTDIVSVDPIVYEGIPFVSGSIRGLGLDRGNNLWIATGNSERRIFRFDGQEVTCWDDEILSNQDPFQLLVPPQGDIWILTLDSNIIAFQNDRWNLLPDTPSIFTRLSVGLNGSIWVGGEKEVFSYIDGQWVKRLEWDSSEGNPFTIAADSLGGVWVVYGNINEKPRLIYLKKEELTEYPYPNDQNLNNQSLVQIHLLVDRDNRLWLGDQEGLYMLEDGTTTISQKTWGKIKTDSRP